MVDPDLNDAFQTPFYQLATWGHLMVVATIKITTNIDSYWAMVFWHDPFSDMMIDYNGYDSTTNPPTPGNVPEFYWFLFSRWSSYNGGNEWDIDSDGDSLVNGLDIDRNRWFTD